MWYLIAAILFSSLFSIIFKVCQNKDIDSGEVILFNYITGMVFCIVPIFSKVLLKEEVSFAEYTIPFNCIALALIQGLLFFFGFWIMARSTWRNGIALTNAAARSSLVLPVLLSWMFLSQGKPDWLSVALVVLAMIFIVVPNDFQKHDPSLYRSPSDHVRKVKAIIALIAVFFTYGISDFFLKVVQHSVSEGVSDEVVVSNHLSFQMCFIFISAMLCSLVYCIVSGTFKKYRIKWATVFGGILLGLVNTGCTACVLRALMTISTNVFYPLYNIGIVVIGALVGVLFFKEKIKGLQYAGLAVAVLAIAVTLVR